MITVTTQAELEAAVAGPRVVSIAGGVYSILLHKIDGVIFRAADPDDPPVIANLRITQCVGLTFDGIDFANQHPAPAAFDAPWQATECTRLWFRDCTVRGVMQPAGRGHGLTFTGCGEVVLTGCGFEALRKGLILRQCNGATVENCSFRAIAEDGIGLGASTNVTIRDTRMLDFWADPKDEPHTDAVDMGHAGCSDILIERLDVMDAATRPPAGLVQLRTQGVFAKSADRVTIRDCFFGLSSLRAVNIADGDGVVVEDVKIRALANDAVPLITIPKA